MPDNILPIAALLLVASAVIGPIVLHRDFRFHLPIVAVPLRFGELPEHVQDFMAPVSVTIRPLGFDLIGYFEITGTTTGTASYLALFENRATNELADISFVTTIPVPVITRGFVEFIARSSDELRLETNTNGAPTALFPAAHHIFRFPQVNDAAVLYRMHRMLVREKLGDVPLRIPDREKAIEELSRRLRRYVQTQVARGYMYCEDGGQYARLTWKGTLVMSWRGLWPVAVARRVRMHREAEAWLAKLESSGV